MNFDQHLDNREFLNQLENCTLAPEVFNHIGHLRFCFLCLENAPLEAAIERICNTIKAYAISLEVEEKFNLSLTHALVRIVERRTLQTPQQSWQAFLQANTDLVENTQDVLRLHFSDELLYSERARTELILPDLAPI
ncbi:MAG: hypothetical protein ACPG4U_00940 [Pseudomonadales bacterium]